MSALDSKLRSQLDGVCQKARDKAEEAALSALQKRAVDAAEPHPHFTAAERKLRNRLRARGRQAGDVRRTNKTQGIEQLAQELAYESWHRMMFARFLAENQLLMHPDGVAVSLEECEELARVGQAFQPDGPSSPDVRLESLTYNGFTLAARYASKMLPQVFRTDDALLEVEFAPEHRLALEKLLANLPSETFLADDSLGWIYQFWQSKRKDEVNKSGEKIDSRTLSAVTQLFTEDYMVQFLLHNTIGAWRCARHAVGQAFQPDARVGQAFQPDTSARAKNVRLESLTYLRWRDDGTPAAGTFDGWPKTLEDFKMIDPCCGSGHFLVAAFNLLVPLRMDDEGLTASESCDAVLRENLFGLELDPRCTQIAAFALAVAAWKYPGEDGQPLGYRELPPLNIACTGIGPQATEDEWLKLAEQSVGRIGNPSYKPMTVLSREPILNGLRNLHALFSDAPTLGSLIDPNQLSADLISADYETLQPYLAAALTAETADDDAHERAVAAAGMVKAAELLAGEYTLVATNVPYLGRGKQGEPLKKHLEKHYPEGKADLATAFVLRCLGLCAQGGTTALVTPQNWLFLTTYTRLRESLLKQRTWNFVARLGPCAFETIGGHVVNVALLVLSADKPSEAMMTGVDVSAAKQPAEKAAYLRGDSPAKIAVKMQAEQLKNPDAVITLNSLTGTLLNTYAVSTQGLKTGDDDRWRRAFWEIGVTNTCWRFLQSTVDTTVLYGGREGVVDWSRQGDGLARLQGMQAWDRIGVAVKLMGLIPATLYTGEIFDSNVAPITPRDEDATGAIWCFCESGAFATTIRQINSKLSIAEGTVVKVPFDHAHWQAVAAEKYPNGLPEPESDDPTQWLFHGRPEASTAPLQVAVARLLGYRWPAELDTEMRLSARARELVQCCDELRKFADADGIVCIPAVRAESPADERLAELLQAVGQAFQPDVGRQAGKPDLQDWLRNDFFEQHCKLFHNRPFIWQIWDGRKDGFACLVNYHKLDYQALDNLTHSCLESWIKKQAGDAKTGKVGADVRLAAAQALQKKLEMILAGEPPYDIFVRWKPLHEQAIGWNPDLNDGVRMNIRPFVEAGILRKNPNIKWTKDRGKEPRRDKDDYPWFWKGNEFLGERVNDIHLTIAEKQK
ncbi:MAG: Eco57I restriction-modification methylase domain-containing protein [Thermoguttaceae bacterium]